MLLALVSDTHGVFDPVLANHFAGADAILHAGDVGSHGGHAAVLARLREVCPAVHAVRGNVDDDAAARQDLPEFLLLTLAGWRVLLIHILADAAAAIQRHRPDIVIHGHSHKYSVEEVAAPHGGVLLQVNPGSAGPARFNLSRTAALLTLPPKGAPEGGLIASMVWHGSQPAVVSRGWLRAAMHPLPCPSAMLQSAGSSLVWSGSSWHRRRRPACPRLAGCRGKARHRERLAAGSGGSPAALLHKAASARSQSCQPQSCNLDWCGLAASAYQVGTGLRCCLDTAGSMPTPVIAVWVGKCAVLAQQQV